MTHPSKSTAVWGVLWKVNQVLVPLIVAWGIWVTKNCSEFQSFMNQGNRFTQTDGYALKIDMLTKLESLQDKFDKKNAAQDATIASLPPADWRERIVSLEKTVKEQNAEIIKVLMSNAEKITKLETVLGEHMKKP